MKSLKIIKIKVTKNKTYLYLDNNDKLELLEDTLVDFNLYVNKVISNKEINDINKKDKVNRFFKYASSLIKQRDYSSKEIKDKLFKKGANKEEINNVIARLSRYNLIDDENIIKMTYDRANYYHYGYNRIKDTLIKKGIYDVPNIDNKREEEHSFILFNILDKKINNVPLNQKKAKIYTKMLRDGFDKVFIDNLIENTSNIDKETEINLLKKDFSIILKRYVRKYKGKDLIDKVVNALLNKGYSYKDINDVKGDIDYEIY